MKYLFVLLFLVGCVSKQVAEKKGSPFAISKGKGLNNSFILVGSSKACSVKWEALRGVLTHRMNCPGISSKELFPLLIEMAVRFKKDAPFRIDYVRYTSKDFTRDERRLAKMMAQSRMWSEFSKSKDFKDQTFPNDFIKKVIDKKELLSLVPRALNVVGYGFKVDDVEITRFAPAERSKYKKSLESDFSLEENPLVVPENIRVVFKNNYQ